MIRILYSNIRATALEQIAASKAGAWVYVVEPTDSDLQELSEKYGMDEDLLNDAIDPYESPRIERDKDAVYLFTRYCVPETSVNATETLLLVLKNNMLITILRSKATVLDRLLDGRELVLTTQKTKLMLQILEEVNNSYRRHVNRISKRIISVRSQLKQTDLSNETIVGFIEMEDDLNEFLSALQPYAATLRRLLDGRQPRLYEEDRDLVEDLSLGTNELIDLVKSRLKTIVNIRQAHEAISAAELNRIFKRLTSISIFLMVPTVIAGLYGMNVALPFANEPWAFWFVVGLMIVIITVVIAIFRRKRWL